MRIVNPKRGAVINPLRNDGNLRNKPCPCNSGKKVKKCCGRFPFITLEDDVKVRSAMRIAGLL